MDLTNTAHHRISVLPTQERSGDVATNTKNDSLAKQFKRNLWICALAYNVDTNASTFKTLNSRTRSQSPPKIYLPTPHTLAITTRATLRWTFSISPILPPGCSIYCEAAHSTPARLYLFRDTCIEMALVCSSKTKKGAKPALRKNVSRHSNHRSQRHTKNQNTQCS